MVGQTSGHMQDGLPAWQPRTRPVEISSMKYMRLGPTMSSPAGRAPLRHASGQLPDLILRDSERRLVQPCAAVLSHPDSIPLVLYGKAACSGLSGRRTRGDPLLLPA